MFFIQLITSFALSAPSLLAPDGVVWLGPLPPAESPYRDVVLVDPESGNLWVENTDAAGFHRHWTGEKWDHPETVPDDVGHTIAQGKLTEVTDALGVRRRYVYDDKGLLNVIRWADGESVKVDYDKAKRVKRIAGPGTSVWTFDWRNGLEVKGPGNLDLTVRRMGDRSKRTVEVKDYKGRSIRLNYSHGKLSSWQNPIGQMMKFKWSKNKLRASDVTGRHWETTWDDNFKMLELKEPDSSRWKWNRSDEGDLNKIVDPNGRSLELSKVSIGLEINYGARRLRLKHDAQGQVTEISDPLSRIAHLKRDQNGNLTVIEDALGGRVKFERKGGELSEIKTRSGATWVLERDQMGMLSKIISPHGSVFALERDPMGNVIRLRDGHYGTTHFERDSQGRILKIRDPQNRTNSFVWSNQNRIKQIRRPDGSQISLNRDSLGDISGLKFRNKTIEISRNASGLVTGIGDIKFKRNGRGLISAFSLPDREEMAVRRDMSGLISGLYRGKYRLRLSRNHLGLPVKWAEDNGNTVSISRDLRGHIYKSISDDVILTRDSRGWVSTAEVNGNKWRWMRDVAGNAMRVVGPDDLSLGIDREMSGKIKHIRYPDGSLKQFSSLPKTIISSWIGDNGDLLKKLEYKLNSAGQLEQIVENKLVTRMRRDPIGRLVAVEASDKVQWSQSLDGAFDGYGGMVVYDINGRVLDAQSPSGLEHWGLSSGYFSYQRDNKNRLNTFISDKGKGFIRYDDLDRVRSICGAGWQCWRFEYDPRGYLKSYSPPQGLAVSLIWRPDTLEQSRQFGSDISESQVLLLSGANKWLQGPLGLAAARQGGAMQLYFHELRKKIAMIRLQGSPPALVRSGLGASYLGVETEIFGGPCQLQIFAGGPVFCGDVAFESLSMQRLDGNLDSALLPSGAQNHRIVDPELFSSRSPWRDPMGILRGMGLLPELESGWKTLYPLESPVSWLPSSFEGRSPSGPDIRSIPVNADKIEWIYLSAILKGEGDPLPSALVSSMIRDELDLAEPYFAALDTSIWWLNPTKEHPNLAHIYTME